MLDAAALIEELNSASISLLLLRKFGKYLAFIRLVATRFD